MALKIDIEKKDILLILLLSAIFILFKVFLFTDSVSVDLAFYKKNYAPIVLKDYYLGNMSPEIQHGPFMIYTIKAANNICGNNLLCWDMPLFAFSLMLFIALYFFVKIIFGTAAAFLSTLLAVVSPSMNVISLHFSPHVFYVFLSATALFLFILSIRENNGLLLVLSFAFCAFSLLYIIMSVALIGSILAYLFLFKNPFVKRFIPNRHFFSGIILFLVIIAVACPAFIFKLRIIDTYSFLKDQQIEKKDRRMDAVSIDFIKNAAAGEGLFTFFLIAGIFSLIILSKKEKWLWVFILYMIIHGFFMLFSTGLMVYSALSMLLLYTSFSVLLIRWANEIRKEKKILIMAIALVIIITSAGISSRLYLKDRNLILFQEGMKKVFLYFQDKGINNTNVLVIDASMVHYYFNKTGLNVTAINLRHPRLESLNYTYEYAVYANVFNLNLSRGKGSLKERMEKVNSSCIFEKSITDEILMPGEPILFIFYCKNLSMKEE